MGGKTTFEAARAQFVSSLEAQGTPAAWAAYEDPRDVPLPLLEAGFGPQADALLAQQGLLVDDATLSDMLGQQRSAVQEIARNVQGIAEKAAKTGGEIASITERLVRSEATTQASLDAVAETAPASGLARLPADIGAWKRRLATILVGQAAPEASAAFMLGVDAPMLAARMRGTAFERRPAFSRFAQAEQAAHSEAARMVAALEKRDWDTGTPAYSAASDAMATMLAAGSEMATAR